MGQSKQGIGVVGAALIGVGGMVGGGIFAVLGTAATQAKGGTPLAFAIAGIVALLTSYSYAKLSVKYQSSGGTATFLDKAFGVNLATGTLNLILWLSYLVTIALYAAAFGSYASTFFAGGGWFLEHGLITASIVAAAGINLLSSAIVSKSETYIVILKLVLLGIVIVAGASHVDTDRLAVSNWAAPGALVMGGMVIFVAYEGFELIANAAEDVRDPEKTLPRAFYLCVGFVIILYIVIAVVTVGSIDAETIRNAKDYALAEAAKPALGHAGFIIVSASALLATFSAINATIYGNARLGFTLACDGELPGQMEKETWHRPVTGVSVTAILSLVLANSFKLESIAMLGSGGFLVIFAMVNLAGWKLHKETGAKRFICLAATIACAGALGALLWHTFQTNPTALIAFGGLILFAFLFELIYPRIVGRKERAL